MQLTDLKSVTKTIAQKLEAVDWTIESLVTAQPDDLTAISGIGDVKAQQIIFEAQKLLNEHRAFEAKQLDNEALYMATHRQDNPPSPPVYHQTSPAFAPETLSGQRPPLSVRAQRIYDQAKAAMETEE